MAWERFALEVDNPFKSLSFSYAQAFISRTIAFTRRSLLRLRSTFYRTNSFVARLSRGGDFHFRGRRKREEPLMPSPYGESAIGIAILAWNVVSPCSLTLAKDKRYHRCSYAMASARSICLQCARMARNIRKRIFPADFTKWTAYFRHCQSFVLIWKCERWKDSSDTRSLSIVGSFYWFSHFSSFLLFIIADLSILYQLVFEWKF